MLTTITVIILTYNEEQHIARSINSLKDSVDEIFIVDSFSNDRTIEIAERMGAKVFQNPFVNQAVQFNWALQNCDIRSDWILRIDADEFIDNKKKLNLKSYLSELPNNVNGLHISRKIVFMGRELLHGGWCPKWDLRIFRKECGVCENSWVDEHIVLTKGISQKLHLDFVDENLNDLNWWIAKHNDYASREAVNYFLLQKELKERIVVQPKFLGNDAERKRWLKLKYHVFPLFVRPFLNFIFRYFLKFGFLDGKRGFIWHVLQGFWYRFLVDVKIYELRKRFKNNPEEIIAYIKNTY